MLSSDVGFRQIQRLLFSIRINKVFYGAVYSLLNIDPQRVPLVEQRDGVSAVPSGGRLGGHVRRELQTASH